MFILTRSLLSDMYKFMFSFFVFLQVAKIKMCDGFTDYLLFFSERNGSP